jgi:predicted Zn-ribbon and HTH transcriptional regulator
MLKKGRTFTVEVSEWRCHCERCGYEWISVGQEAPDRCAGCKAPHWNVAKGVLKRGPKIRIPKP